MEYQEIEFQSSGGVTIKGWLITGKLDKILIMTHPMPFTRYGFSVKSQGMMKVSKVEVELLKTAKVLNDAGYHIFTFDFRNHGESGEGNNGATGVGLNEWPDVVGAINYIKDRPELHNMAIGFVSHCMGANATIMAMSNAKESFQDVKCMVAVQPVSMSILVPNLIKDKFPIFARLAPKIDKKSKALTGNSLQDMSPANYVKDISVPTLYVQVRNDPWTKPEDGENFYKNTPEPKELFWIEGDLERFDGYNYFGAHPEKLLKFLAKYM